MTTPFAQPVTGGRHQNGLNHRDTEKTNDRGRVIGLLALFLSSRCLCVSVVSCPPTIPLPATLRSRMDLMTSANFDIVIVGAGAAGLTAAIGLARSGFRVAAV